MILGTPSVLSTILVRVAFPSRGAHSLAWMVSNHPFIDTYIFRIAGNTNAPAFSLCRTVLILLTVRYAGAKALVGTLFFAVERSGISKKRVSIAVPLASNTNLTRRHFRESSIIETAVSTLITVIMKCTVALVGTGGRDR